MIALLAAITLAPLFRPGLVLQQGQAVPVWGTAPAHAKILITCGAARTAAFADGAGFWIGYVGPFSPQPALLTLSARQADHPDQSAAAEGLAVGEVWLGSGEVDAAVAGAFARHLESRLGVPVAIVGVTPATLDRVAPDAARGLLWFGPAAPNTDDIARCRAEFGVSDLPVYWAGALPASAPSLQLPRTGQAVTIDQPDKAEVGRRLALIAKMRVYHIPEDDSGPVLVSAQPEGAAMRLQFRFGDNGLIASGRPLQGFELAGADGRFHPATATIAGSIVTVRSPAVRRPVAVRYGWRGTPEPNLFNGAGLPAGPFAWP